MTMEAGDSLPLPTWRVRSTVVLGLGIIATGAFLGLTLRPIWPWAPSWVTDSVPYGVAIGMMVLGLFVLGEVWHWAQRLWRTIAGSALIAAGLAMLVLPGPGLVTIAAGLFVLSREYDWAHRRYERLSARLHAAKARAQGAMAARRDARDQQRDARPVVRGPTPLSTRDDDRQRLPDLGGVDLEIDLVERRECA